MTKATKYAVVTKKPALQYMVLMDKQRVIRIYRHMKLKNKDCELYMYIDKKWIKAPL